MKPELTALAAILAALTLQGCSNTAAGVGKDSSAFIGAIKPLNPLAAPVPTPAPVIETAPGKQYFPLPNLEK